MIKRILNHGDSLWSMLYTFLRLGAGILVLPVALRNIPNVEMGIYYTFTSLTGFALLLDFGMLGTIGRSASYAWGGASHFTAKGLPEYNGETSPNRSLLIALTHLTRFWYYLLAIAVGILLMIFGSWFIKARISEETLDPNLIWCWIFYCFVTAYGLGTGFWAILSLGIGDVRVVSRYGVISHTVATILLLVGLLIGLKLWAYAISLLIGPALHRYLVKKRYLSLLGNPLPPIINLPDFDILKKLWPMTWRMGVTTLGEFATQRGNILVASAFLGLETTARYGLSLNLFAILFQLTGMPLFVAFPKINQALIQRNVPEVRQLFFSRTYVGFGLACLGGGILIQFGSDLLGFIGSQTQLLPMAASTFLFIIYLFDRHQNSYANLVIGTNENPFVFPTIITGVVMIGISIILTPLYGVTGLLLSHGITQLAWNHWWPVLRGLKTLKI